MGRFRNFVAFGYFERPKANKYYSLPDLWHAEVGCYSFKLYDVVMRCQWRENHLVYILIELWIEQAWNILSNESLGHKRQQSINKCGPHISVVFAPALLSGN